MQLDEFLKSDLLYRFDKSHLNKTFYILGLLQYFAVSIFLTIVSFMIIFADIPIENKFVVFIFFYFVFNVCKCIYLSITFEFFEIYNDKVIFKYSKLIVLKKVEIGGYNFLRIDGAFVITKMEKSLLKKILEILNPKIILCFFPPNERHKCIDIFFKMKNQI